MDDAVIVDDAAVVNVVDLDVDAHFRDVDHYSDENCGHEIQHWSSCGRDKGRQHGAKHLSVILPRRAAHTCLPSWRRCAAANVSNHTPQPWGVLETQGITSE